MVVLGKGDFLRFCRSCGSPNITGISPKEQGHVQWECQDCGNKWNEFKYEQKQDDSEFVTGDLKDGSEIIYQNDLEVRIENGTFVYKSNGKEVNLSDLYSKLNEIGNITQSFKERDQAHKRLLIITAMSNALLEGEFTPEELRKIASVLDKVEERL